MRRRDSGTGCGARGHAHASMHPGGSGAPPAWPLRAGCEELADLGRECLMRSAAWSRSSSHGRRGQPSRWSAGRRARLHLVCDARAAPQRSRWRKLRPPVAQRGIVWMRLPALRSLARMSGLSDMRKMSARVCMAPRTGRWRQANPAPVQTTRTMVLDPLPDATARTRRRPPPVRCKVLTQMVKPQCVATKHV